MRRFGGRDGARMGAQAQGESWQEADEEKSFHAPRMGRERRSSGCLLPASVRPLWPYERAALAGLFLEFFQPFVERQRELLCVANLELFAKYKRLARDLDVDAVSANHPKLLFHGLKKRAWIGLGNARR